MAPFGLCWIYSSIWLILQTFFVSLRPMGILLHHFQSSLVVDFQRWGHMVRGCQGSHTIACLISNRFRCMTSVVLTFARCTWVHVRLAASCPRIFSLQTTTFHWPPPHMLYIMEQRGTHSWTCSNLGDTLIIDDFNAQTGDLQTPHHGQMLDLVCTSMPMPMLLDLQRSSDDILGPLPRSNHHLLQFCESFIFVILIGLPNQPGFDFFTCWPHWGCKRCGLHHCQLLSHYYLYLLHFPLFLSS